VIPAAARAAIRAAAWDAHQLAVDHPEDVADHIAEQLAAAGWTISPAAESNITNA
jgi:hypothetical protein